MYVYIYVCVCTCPHTYSSTRAHKLKVFVRSHVTIIHNVDTYVHIYTNHRVLTCLHTHTYKPYIHNCKHYILTLHLMQA